jgi:hypothetical protein
VESYDPDYKVAPFEKKVPPKGDGVIEAAIQAGKDYINDILSELPLSADPPNPYRWVVKYLHDFLERNDYVVFPTDKNLSISVVTREWFINNTQKLLDDRENYVPLSVGEHCSIYGKKLKKLKPLARPAIVNSYKSSLHSSYQNKPSETPEKLVSFGLNFQIFMTYPRFIRIP